MNTSAADARQFPAGVGTAHSNQAPFSQMILGERSLVTLALVRLFFGFLWFQQLAWKMPPDFGGLHHEVEREVQYTILPGYSALIQNVLLAHFSLLGACVWATEFLIGVSLLFGLFTRLGAALALLFSIQLYIGIAYAPGEWYWAYGMLLLLSLTLVVIPTGRQLGFDQTLWQRLSQSTKISRSARLLLWFI